MYEKHTSAEKENEKQGPRIQKENVYHFREKSSQEKKKQGS